MLRFCAVFAFFFALFIQSTLACGFNFVGDCSTGISLKINGTQDSFAVATCPYLLQFDGFSLGNLQSLSLARAKATTWESCQNNVSGVALFYRVFEQGIPGGSWQSIDLQEDFNTLVGPYTTRYRSVNTNASLTDGLEAGKTYVLEVYFQAAVDTIGDDFIPETVLLQNNNGQNYRFTFQYGGADAPPFLVTTTKAVHVKCHGDSTGVAAVGVYGNPNGLFYQWSTGGNNYWILGNIPAGVYSVTVTGAGGYSASDTIEIKQPMPLTAQFTVSGLGCDGSPGAASAEITGGSKPYFYHWENGSQDSTATFPDSGDHSLTVTDIKGCAADFSVNVPPQHIDTTSIAARICEGGSYSAGGMDFAVQGYYEINLPGANGACDTVLQLNLSVEPLPVVSMDVEVAAPFACSAADSVHLVLRAEAGGGLLAFEWRLDGALLSTADTCRFAISGAGILPIVIATDTFGCSVQAGGDTVVIPIPEPMAIEPVLTNPTGNLENGTIHLLISGGIPSYSVLWDNGSAADALTGIGPGTYCATVTDQRGCTSTVCATLETSGVATAGEEAILKISPNPACRGQQVKIALPEYFVGQEVHLEILDWSGQALMRSTGVPGQKQMAVFLPENLPPGVFVLRLYAPKGRGVIGRFTAY